MKNNITPLKIIKIYTEQYQTFSSTFSVYYNLITFEYIFSVFFYANCWKNAPQLFAKRIHNEFNKRPSYISLEKINLECGFVSNKFAAEYNLSTIWH